MPFNPTFRTATSSVPGRSPSPPRRFVEPLSPRRVPARPVPIEPNFNYPALNDSVNFTVKPEQAYDAFNATPKSRIRSSSYKSGHHRTPSTIDTLAEAALAVSPSYHAPAAGTLYGHGTSHARTAASERGMGEPPHKRARSEILPSPLVSQHASRPATSYEHGQQLYGVTMQAPHAGHTFDSRIEEASLLLNFRTGGLSVNKQSLPPPPVPAAYNSTGTRPHANSFPQATHAPRPVDLGSQAGLLPSFNQQLNASSCPKLPSQQTFEVSDPSPGSIGQKRIGSEKIPVAACKPSSAPWADIEPHDPLPGQLPFPPEALEPRGTSSASSVSLFRSETSEFTSKIRRGQLKGKLKAPNRKSNAEKGSLKKTASRKKTPGSSRASRNTSEAPLEHAVDHERRKSVSDVTLPSQRIYDPGPIQRAKSVPPGTQMVIRPALPVKLSRRSIKTVDNIICAGCETTRETSNLNGELDQWISCNGCKKWFHVDCAGFKKASEVRDVDKYFCSVCEPNHGKTTWVRKSTRAHVAVDYAELQRGVLKTSEESMEHHYVQPIKDGTFQFDPDTFPRLRPELVTKDFFEKSGTFVEPICIPAEWNPRPWLETQSNAFPIVNVPGQTNNSPLTNLMTEDYEYDTVPDEGQDKLDMVMPENLTVRQVCHLVGSETPLDVIDVKTQNSGAKWTLGRWADYYEEKTEEKPIRNVISLEVSQSKLGRLLRRPKVVRDIDLQDQVWPQKEIDQGKYPRVQYYCLMSIADSYTDFHIDFGGSSVYYHILKGKKTFFFIPPKMKHLKAYEEWNDSPQQNYTFLPNITKECYRVDLSEGDTMLIPSGWIHAVWTPETSLVIGGNFLNRMSYKNQFKVVDIEKNNNTPMKFRYPFFQKIMWYTAIQYLEQDPLPEAVSQLFLDGRKFERQYPVWADFDGEIAATDQRPGAKNARYYSQAEIEGLPDLCNYIFRIVMLVMGRVEGISADRMKRINASIPKGHGEPMEVAKTFAFWVAWKCGNEDPPAWAHPDAVLPASKDEGASKKLSARALKDMERKEAIAASRVAPERQSVRVKNAAAAADAGASGPMATPERTSSYLPPPPTSQYPSRDSFDHQMTLSQTMSVAQPMQPMPPMMSEMTGQHISTPKTSVLGPKRVACDACRKRRIRCKHKDLVMEAPHISRMSPSDLHDNIIVTLPKPQQPANYLANSADAPQSGVSSGTSTYINTNIPVTTNGSTGFGDSSKRGRSKACFECRKSKRRCIHDENGNVDPVKAAETPVPRGSTSSKKRSAEDSPAQAKKKQKQSSPEQAISEQPSTSPNPPVRQPISSYQPTPSHPEATATEKSTQPSPIPRKVDHEQSALDPHLFSPYAEHAEHGTYHQPYSYTANAYPLQSLEQIANEVLDMNHEDDVHIFHETMAHGTEPSRPDESVDSAVSLPGSDDGKQVQQDESASGPVVYCGLPLPQNDLPLYRPPPPPSQSPEQTKRQPHVHVGKPETRLMGVGTGVSENHLELTKSFQEDNLGLRGRQSIGQMT